MNTSIYNTTGEPLIFKCARKLADYRMTYPGQLKPQNAYFELTENCNIITPTYNGEIGNAVPFSVYHGRDRRYYFHPSLPLKAVNKLGRDLLPYMEKVRAGIFMAYDGNNYIARLTEDAQQAEDEILAIIARAEAYEFIPC